jgi:hypothetical protein
LYFGYKGGQIQLLTRIFAELNYIGVHYHQINVIRPKGTTLAV